MTWKASIAFGLALVVADQRAANSQSWILDDTLLTPPSSEAEKTAVIEQATKFILENMPCSKTGQNEVEYYSTFIGPTIQNGNLRVDEKRAITKKVNNYRARYFYTSAANISDLSPDVKTDGEKIVIECTQGKCFTSEEGLYDGSERLVTETGSSVRQYYRLCNAEIAPRVGRAFSALIAASGGKPAPF